MNGLGDQPDLMEMLGGQAKAYARVFAEQSAERHQAPSALALAALMMGTAHRLIEDGQAQWLAEVLDAVDEHLEVALGERTLH